LFLLRIHIWSQRRSRILARNTIRYNGTWDGEVRVGRRETPEGQRFSTSLMLLKFNLTVFQGFRVDRHHRKFHLARIEKSSQLATWMNLSERAVLTELRLAPSLQLVPSPIVCAFQRRAEHPLLLLNHHFSCEACKLAWDILGPVVAAVYR
jgi:hypothetical protein